MFRQFRTLIFCQKNQQITFKDTLIANGQASALITTGWPPKENFQHFCTDSKDQITGGYSVTEACQVCQLAPDNG
jgi:hypothetical protein